MSGSTARDRLARNAALLIKASANVPFRSMFLIKLLSLLSSRGSNRNDHQAVPVIKFLLVLHLLMPGRDDGLPFRIDL